MQNLPRCKGSQSQVHLCCRSSGCNQYPFMCQNRNCICKDLHQYCSSQIDFGKLIAYVHLNETHCESNIGQAMNKIIKEFENLTKQVEILNGHIELLKSDTKTNFATKQFLESLHTEAKYQMNGNYIGNLLDSYERHKSHNKYKQRNADSFKLQCIQHSVMKSADWLKSLNNCFLLGYNWSAKYRSANLHIEPENKIVEKITDRIGMSCCLIEQPLKNYNHSWRFKILNQSHIVMIGLCSKKKMTAKLFNWIGQWGQIGHGLYIVGSYVYHDNDLNFNNKQIDFHLKTGNIIHVTWDQFNCKIHYLNETTKKTYQMNVEYNQDLHICALMHKNGDSVQLL